ncbi:MAG TPA: DUF4255 domain-containing protein, partial [Bacteroidales bacterium]|nr:DUF4255 domain-containing protein [Bacteroidales bacterium]
MSNSLAIATVTAVIKKILESSLPDPEDPALSKVTVTTFRPDKLPSEVSDKGVNLYLYLVTHNIALRNADNPNYSSDGRLVQRPQVTLDLHYLLTFYGEDKVLEPQRLLGNAVRTLHSRPILTRKIIEKAITEYLSNPDDTSFSFLVNSNLVEALETVKITPVSLSLEELSKLWSVFFQTPYRLSVAYTASVVLIESDDAPQSALPVREHSVYAVPFRQPVIEKVLSDEGEDKPIVAESTLVIRGKKLRGDTTHVIIDGTEVKTRSISETQVEIKLPASLLSGVHGLQVVHKMQIGTPPVLHNGVESNLFAFVLHPTIKKESDGITDDITVSNLQGTGNDPRSADLKIKVKPEIGEEQRMVLILNEISNVESASYTFVGKSRKDEPDTIEIHVRGVKAAD